MIDDYELGSALFGRKRVEERADKIGTTVMYGTAVTNSEDGTVRVMLDGNVTAAEDGDSLDVELPTSPSVKEGDTVMVTLTGGVAKAPMVTAVAKSGDRIKADIDDFKEYAEVEYTHESTFDEVTGAITNTIAANYSASAPNLSPFFSFDEPAADSITNDYWARYAANPSANTRNTSATVTPLSDGWLHIVKTAGTSNVIFAPKAQPFVSANGKYTLLFEFKNVTVSGTNRMQIATVNYGQLCATGASYYFTVAEGMQRFVFPSDGLEIRSTNSELVRFNLNSALVVTCDMRVSLYEGEYAGGYKPFNLSKAEAVKEYATHSYVSQTADAIELEVSQTYLSQADAATTYATQTALTQTADAIKLAASQTYATKGEAVDGNKIDASTLESGYIASNGTIASTQAPQNAVVTPFIAVTPGQILTFRSTIDAHPASFRAWCAYSFYDSNEAQVGTRPNKYGTTDVDLTVGYDSITVPTGAAYMRCCWRTYDGAHASLTEDVETVSHADLTYASKAALTVATDSITSLVQGNATYTDPVSGQTVTSALGTQVTQTASDVSTLLTDVGGIQTMIRETTDGILVAKTGNTVGALVNADGSFDVVELSWSGDTPTIGDALASFDASEINLGNNSSSSLISFCDGRGNLSFSYDSNISNGAVLSLEGKPWTEGISSHSTGVELRNRNTSDDLESHVRITPDDEIRIEQIDDYLGVETTIGSIRMYTLAPYGEIISLYSNYLKVDNPYGPAAYVDMAVLAKILRNTTVAVNQTYTGNGAHFETDTSTSASSITGDVCGRNVCFPMKFVLTSNHQFSSTKIAQIADASCYPSKTAQIPVFCISTNWSSPSTGWMYINTSGEVMLWTAGAVGIIFAQVNYMTA